MIVKISDTYFSVFSIVTKAPGTCRTLNYAKSKDSFIVFLVWSGILFRYCLFAYASM